MACRTSGGRRSRQRRQNCCRAGIARPQPWAWQVFILLPFWGFGPTEIASLFKKFRKHGAAVRARSLFIATVPSQLLSHRHACKKALEVFEVPSERVPRFVDRVTFRQKLEIGQFHFSFTFRRAGCSQIASVELEGLRGLRVRVLDGLALEEPFHFVAVGDELGERDLEAPFVVDAGLERTRVLLEPP